MKTQLSTVALFLLVPTAALGDYFIRLHVGPISLFAYRGVVLIGAFMIAPLGGRFAVRFTRTAQLALVAMGFWFAWSVLALLLWAPHTRRAFLDTALLLFDALALFTPVLLGAHRLERARMLLLGWPVAFIGAGAIAAWEAMTGHHLPGSWTALHHGSYVLKDTALATFGNPNDYGAFLAMAVPFLMFGLIVSQRAARCLYAALLISVPYLLVLTGSRAVAVAVVAEFVVLAALALNSRALRRHVTLATLGFAALGAIAYASVHTNFQVKIENVAQRGVLAAPSVNERWGLFLDGVYLIEHSAGLGAGPYGFEEAVAAGGTPYWTGHDMDPHDFWMEILADYGVFTFMLFVTWLLSACASFLAALRRGELTLGAVGLMAIVGYAIACLAPSTYLSSSINWAFLSTILALAVGVESRLGARYCGEVAST